MNDKSFTLYAWLPELKMNCQQLFLKIKKIISSNQEGLEKDWLCHLLDKDKGVKWISIKNNLSVEQKEEIEKQRIPGLSFEEEEGRFYPEASSAAHILGFLGKDQWGKPKGYFGLEGFYNNQLQGEVGFGSKAKNWFDYFNLINSSSRNQPKKGRDLVLYLDRTVQFLVEEELEKGIKKYGAVGGWVLVMDPKTGGIIASAAFPSYDPSRFYKYKPQIFTNPVISETFEPGSIFKPLIMAAAFQEGVVEPDTQCDQCDGPVLIGDKKIKTWNDKYYPNSTMVEVIEHSDNVGMVWVINKLGLSKTLSYLKKLGLGDKTGIDLEGEAFLPLKEKAEWYPIDLATVSFGQGIAVTPIQMLTAFSSLANGGKLMQPRVVKEIHDGDKKQIFKPRIVRKVFDSKVTKQMTEILVGAASQGEISWINKEGYKVAGKTGTAQIPIGGHYDKEKTIASFIGYFPADDPSFAMLVSLREPSSSPWGSETAAPLWFSIFKRLSYYWGILPK
jgi:cell division protein FtsI/penicillin-binding protein 2